MCLYLVQHLLHQIKAQQFYIDLDLYHKCKVLQKIENFKDFSRKPSKFKYFSSLCEPCSVIWIIGKVCTVQENCPLYCWHTARWKAGGGSFLLLPGWLWCFPLPGRTKLMWKSPRKSSWSCCPSADPERFVKGGPTLTSYLVGSKYHLKRVIICPPAKRHLSHLNGASLAGRWC